MKRKVLHLVYSLGFGGLEQVIVNLINGSTDYNVEHSIVTLVDEHDIYDQIQPETRLYCLNKPPGLDLTSHWRLYKLLLQIKPDVIHTYNFGTIEYHYVARLAGVPVRIHSDHGRGGDDPHGQNKFNNYFRKSVAKLIDHYIVVSPDLLDWVSGTLKLPPTKIDLIYNGVDTRKYTPNQRKNTVFTFCTVGRLHPVKNQKLLIDAYNLFVSECDSQHNTELHIIGDGPLYGELTSYAESLPVKEQVKFLGYRSDINKLLAQSHAFILSSNYEAMPMSILEAFACQLPVAATDVGGVRHLLTEREGWLCEPDNKYALAKCLEQLASDSAAVCEKASAGYKKVVEKYSMDFMVERYMEVYKARRRIETAS